MPINLKLLDEEKVSKNLDWYKKRAAQAEAWSSKVCRELGVTPQDLRDNLNKKRAH